MNLQAKLTNIANLQLIGSSGDDVLDSLKKDHFQILRMFKPFEKLANQHDLMAKSSVVNHVCAELLVQMTAEEEVFYPAVRLAINDNAMLNVAEVEHAGIKDIIAQVQSIKLVHPMYDARVSVLAKYVANHIKDEEANMFPIIRKTALDLTQLSEEVYAKKADVMAELRDESGTINPAALKSMAINEASRHWLC